MKRLQKGRRRAKRQVSLSENMSRRMDKFPEINWSEIARIAWETELARLESGEILPALTFHERLLRLENKVLGGQK